MVLVDGDGEVAERVLRADVGWNIQTRAGGSNEGVVLMISVIVDDGR